MVDTKPRPVAEFRIGYVKAAVWRNGDFFNTSLVKSYKDGEDWKETDYEYCAVDHSGIARATFPFRRWHQAASAIGCAAQNGAAGSGAVARSAGVPRFRETQNYVRRITNLYSGGGPAGSYAIGGPAHEPVHVERDARGVLYISNTE